jgi:thiamine kinase-like enzyme
MRSPHYIKTIIDQTVQINYNAKLKETVIGYKKDTPLTQIEILKTDWIPKLRDKFDSLYSSLIDEANKSTLDQAKKQWLGEDTIEYINALSVEFPTKIEDMVVCHNDIQECNVLSVRDDASKLAIIDYEYTSLGNREFDLANTLCEFTMDNAYPFYPFIALYIDNCPDQEEFEKLAKLYLKRHWQGLDDQPPNCEEYVEKELQSFLTNLYRSMLLDGIFWGVWSLLMIEVEKINDKIFNFAFCELRMKLSKHLLTLPYIKKAEESAIDQYKQKKD